MADQPLSEISRNWYLCVISDLVSQTTVQHTEKRGNHLRFLPAHPIDTNGKYHQKDKYRKQQCSNTGKEKRKVDERKKKEKTIR